MNEPKRAVVTDEPTAFGAMVDAALARGVDEPDERPRPRTRAEKMLRRPLGRSAARLVPVKPDAMIQMAGKRFPEAAIEQRGALWVAFHPRTGAVLGSHKRRRSLVRGLALRGRA